jgi:hypothetical protein
LGVGQRDGIVHQSLTKMATGIELDNSWTEVRRPAHEVCAAEALIEGEQMGVHLPFDQVGPF